jgi:hypothetical protein
MAEYYCDFTNAADYNEWLEYNGANVNLYVTGTNHRTYCNAGGSGWGYARSPKRAVADGGDIVFDFNIAWGGEGNSTMYQTSDAFAKVHYYLQIGNSKMGLSCWYNNSRDHIYVNKYNGSTSDPEWLKPANTALGKVTYNSTTGVCIVLVDGVELHRATLTPMQDCTFAFQGYAYYRYACTIDISWVRFTAGELSDIMYVGNAGLTAMPLEFDSPYDGFLGNKARYDIVYAPQLTDLFPLPVTWTQRSTSTERYHGDGSVSTQNIYDAEANFEVVGHKSGYFYFYVDNNYMNGLRPWQFYIEALNKVTGQIEIHKFEVSYYYDGAGGNFYCRRYWEPDGTLHEDCRNGVRFVESSFTCVEWIVDEEEQTITWKFRNYSSEYTSVHDFDYDWYRFGKIVKSTVTDFMVVGGYGWWFRGVPGTLDPQMDSALQCLGMDSLLECTCTQWTEKVFNVFRNAIYNPLLPDDPATLKGMKLTNVDGLLSDMALDSVCVIIDMYKRVYIYMLKQDTEIVDSIPDIVCAYRSRTGHYWELIDIKTANDEARIYSQQCSVEVSQETPGVCEYDAAADMSKTMVQLVHEGRVNPLYLRAFKVPGQHKLSIVASEPITAYKVIVNFLLAE